MKKIFLLIILIQAICLVDVLPQKYAWTNIGDRLPNSKSTVTLSSISIIGDSMWVTSGFGTVQNGVAGEIYFSTDRGNSFSIQTTKYGTHSIKMLDSKRGYCGGVEGQIYYTSNGGALWERKFSIGRTLMSIDFPPNSDTGMCTGFLGAVKKITPTGLISINMNNYTSNIYSVSCIDINHCFVAGGEIIGPIFNNQLLINQSYPGTSGIYAISMIDTLEGWCVGDPTAAGAWDSAGCMIIHTKDGRNWEDQVNPVKGKSGTLMAIKALNKNEVWAVGTSGVVIHTTDGGNNWKQEAIGLTKEMLTGIYVVNSNEVYVTGNNKTLLKYGVITDVENIDKSEFSISPNPVTDNISIRNYRGYARIINTFGVQIWFDYIEDNIAIQTDKFPSGIYFIQTQTKTEKFIKI